MAALTPSVSQSPPILRVTTNSPSGEQQELRFSSAFRIGRTDECQVTIRNEYVSRAHAEVLFASGRWSVRDLGSANGVFVDGNRVPEAPIEAALTIVSASKVRSYRLRSNYPRLRLRHPSR